MGKAVVMTLKDVPPITDEERQRYREMEESGEPIDFSDNPPVPPDAFKNAVRGRFYRPVKEQVTLRLDANVLDWFKRNTPKGYQTDINRVLSDYVAEQEKKAG
jgi:uncharacterized protein (DUF4415 family)